jgi:hypothetical protein
MKYDKCTDIQLIKLIQEALITWRSTPQPRIPIWLNPKYHNLFEQQASIGWNHIITGHLSCSWQQATNKSDIHFCQWATYVITTIWLEVYNIWKHRCATNHGLTTEEERRRALLRLTPKVTAMYNEKTHIEFSDQYIFQEDLSVMLSKPTATIKQWLHKATLRVKIGKERLRQKMKIMKNQPSPKIHPFFQQIHKRPVKMCETGRRAYQPSVSGISPVH